MGIDKNFSLPDMSKGGGLSAKTIDVSESEELDLSKLFDYVNALDVNFSTPEGLNKSVKFEDETLKLGDKDIKLDNVLSAELVDDAQVIIKHKNGTEILNVSELNETIAVLQAFKIASLKLNDNVSLIAKDDNGVIRLTDVAGEDIINITTTKSDLEFSKNVALKTCTLETKSVDKNIGGTSVTEDDLVLVDNSGNLILDSTELNKLVGDNGAWNQLLDHNKRININYQSIMDLNDSSFIKAVFETGNDNDAEGTRAIKTFTVDFGGDDGVVEVFNVEDYRNRINNYPKAIWEKEKDSDGNDTDVDTAVLLGLIHPTLGGPDEMIDFTKINASVVLSEDNKNRLDNLETDTSNSDDIKANKDSIDKLNAEVFDGDTSIVATNTSDISTNADNISTNKDNIATNTSDIATNTSDISTNKDNIATNTSDISTNKDNIATNASDISTNKDNISTNASDISTNKDNIATNASNIDKNTNDIAAIDQGISKVSLHTVKVEDGSDNVVTGRVGDVSFSISDDSKTLALKLTGIGSMFVNVYKNNQLLVISSISDDEIDFKVSDDSDLNDGTYYISVEKFIS